jgi:hypothetical protein
MSRLWVFISYLVGSLVGVLAWGYATDGLAVKDWLGWMNNMFGGAIALALHWNANRRNSK